jgi:hypothetical protein
VRLSNIPFRIESSLAGAWYRVTKSRPSSVPFVSGDTFRSLADHVLEKGQAFDPDRVRAGAVIFVEAWQLDVFVRQYLPKIAGPYVLITHNGDLNIDNSYLPLAENKRIIRWFAQNCILVHPKVTAIPIGLENRRLHTNGVLRDYRKLLRRSVRKRMRILYGFTQGTNERERAPALAALRHSPISDPMERTNSRDYRKRLLQYGFVASPPGNGIDCHRTWEALYLRTIPIVKRSSLYASFPGLPVLTVDDWSEIRSWDVSFLEAEYARLAPAINSTPFLRFEYWAGLIEISKTEIAN